MHPFLAANRSEIVARTQDIATNRAAPQTMDPGLLHGSPIFLDQLAARLAQR